MGEGRLACFLCLEGFFSFIVDGGAGLGEGGRDIGCRILEGCAYVTDGDTHEVDASSISSLGAEKGAVLLGLLGELVLAAEVSA